MNWKRLLAYITASVDQELLLRNEYLATEDRILRNQIKGRLRLTEPERISLAETGKRLGRRALEEVAQIVRPETMLGWHRRLIARKFDGSKNRSSAGRTTRVLRRHRLAPAPQRGKRMAWRYLLHDRDAKFCAAFDGTLEAVGIKAVTLRPRSPNLNAHLERWNRSVKEECLSKMILFGEGSLRHCLEHYLWHYHTERNQPGQGNVILFPAPADRIGESFGQICTRERLGGLPQFYYREAA
jgi:hypothetical protein